MSIGLTFQQYLMRVPLFERRSRRAAPNAHSKRLITAALPFPAGIPKPAITTAATTIQVFITLHLRNKFCSRGHGHIPFPSPDSSLHIPPPKTKKPDAATGPHARPTRQPGYPAFRTWDPQLSVSRSRGIWLYENFNKDFPAEPATVETSERNQTPCAPSVA